MHFIDFFKHKEISNALTILIRSNQRKLILNTSKIKRGFKFLSEWRLLWRANKLEF